MSAPPSCCATAPTLLKIWPPMPPMRNFRPWRSCTLRISLRNQPPICAPVLPAVMPCTPCSRQTGAGGVQHLQRGHDLARREGADLELAVGQFGHAAADELLVAVQRVEALGEAAGAA